MKSFLGELTEQLSEKGHSTSVLEEKMLTILKNSSKILGKIAVKKIGITDENLKVIQDVFSRVSNSFFKDYKDYKDYKDSIDKFKDSLEEITRNSNKIIIIDELDRCRPTFSVELLEAIKHLFDVEGLIFVFLINKDQLSESVKNMYGEVNKGEGYFKKFFDINFRLPELNIKEFSKLEFNKKNILEVSKKESGDYENLDIVCNYIFMKILENLEKQKYSAREIQLMNRKYQQVLMTISKDEKRSLPFNFLFSLYFLYREGNRSNSSASFQIWLENNISKKESSERDEWGKYSKGYSLKDDSFVRYLDIIRDHILNFNNIEYRILSSSCNGNKDIGNCMACDKKEECRQFGRQRVKSHPNLNIGIWESENYNIQREERILTYYLRLPISNNFLTEDTIVDFNHLLDMFNIIYSLTGE